MQNEPVAVTPNNWPVGIMIFIKDATDTLMPERFLEKEDGYDAWFNAKVVKSLEVVGATAVTEHDPAMDRVWARALACSNLAPYQFFA